MLVCATVFMHNSGRHVMCMAATCCCLALWHLAWLLICFSTQQESPKAVGHLSADTIADTDVANVETHYMVATHSSKQAISSLGLCVASHCTPAELADAGNFASTCNSCSLLLKQVLLSKLKSQL